MFYFDSIDDWRNCSTGRYVTYSTLVANQPIRQPSQSDSASLAWEMRWPAMYLNTSASSVHFHRQLFGCTSTRPLHRYITPSQQLARNPPAQEDQPNQTNRLRLQNQMKWPSSAGRAQQVNLLRVPREERDSFIHSHNIQHFEKMTLCKLIHSIISFSNIFTEGWKEAYFGSGGFFCSLGKCRMNEWNHFSNFCSNPHRGA